MATMVSPGFAPMYRKIMSRYMLMLMPVKRANTADIRPYIKNGRITEKISILTSPASYFKWWLPRSVMGRPSLHNGQSSG